MKQGLLPVDSEAKAVKLKAYDLKRDDLRSKYFKQRAKGLGLRFIPMTLLKFVIQGRFTKTRS